MPTLKINGKEYTVPPGKTVLEACLENQIEVPYYCYHPGLSVAANCRICLVKTSTSRKLEPSCALQCSDKMEIETESGDVQEARKNVLEFMLINHPIDCPICDKAGECDLQDFTYKHRKGLSRFKEEKVLKETKILGSHIKIWQNRCISCSRCVRFCDEVSGTSELSLVHRGDHSTVETFPGVPINNPLSLNTVDICPVGALKSRDFLYSARVWFMEKTDSVCASCSTGCNIKINVLQQEIKRLEPRPNLEVNQHWMCDEGRLHYKYVHSEKRLKRGKGQTNEELVQKLQSYAPEEVALLTSTYATCEELYLFRKLASALKVEHFGVLPAPEGSTHQFKNFTIHADKSPNSKGVAWILGEPAFTHGFENLTEALKKKKIKALLVFNGIPDYSFPQALTKHLSALEYFALCDILENTWTEKAHTLFAGASFAEKAGTYVNYQGRLQQIRPAIPLVGYNKPELDILQELLMQLKVQEKTWSSETIFKQLAKEYETFHDLTYFNVGNAGVLLNGNGVHRTS
jgi:NADH-quinone oxidoreductase subunit G